MSGRVGQSMGAGGGARCGWARAKRVRAARAVGASPVARRRVGGRQDVDRLPSVREQLGAEEALVS
eukprot:5793918-Prymnesium_polylepis.1